MIKLETLLLLAISLQLVLKTHAEICLLPDKKCKETLNGSSCKEPMCAGKYSIQCTTKLCTINTTTCQNFNELKKSILINSEMRKYNKLMRNLKFCPMSLVFVTHHTDFCSKKKDCFLKQDFAYAGEIINLIEKIDCKCEGTYEHECGNNLCATSAQKCRSLSQLNLNDIKTCENQNVFTHKKLFIN